MTALSAGKLWGLRRLADETGRFKMVAVDQRPPIKTLVSQRRDGGEAPYEDVCSVKALLVEVLAPHASAVLLDPHYAYPAAIGLVPPSRGLIVTLEDSIFEEGSGGRTSREIDEWSVAKIKQTGADAVKVLTWYRPDAANDVVEHQQRFTEQVGQACRQFDIPFVLELLVYPLRGDAGDTVDYDTAPEKKAEHVIESVESFADHRFGVDLFKLESPVPAATVGDLPEGEVSAWFDALDRAAGRPWVLLSAGASRDDFEQLLVHAFDAGASGYLAGRSIWWQAFRAFPDLDLMRARLAMGGVPFMQQINRLTDEAARPWFEHPCFGEGPALAGAGPAFRASYSSPV